MVIQDPYQFAPLTALVIFDTPEDSQISIHTPGKTPQTAIDYTFQGFNKHHEIPIYGLYADALNQVTLQMETKNGLSSQTEIELQTEPLPVNIPIFQMDKVEVTRYSPGLNFTFLAYKPIFDLNGDVRWYSTRNSWQVFTQLENGRFLFTYPIDESFHRAILEQDLLGKIYTMYNLEGGIHHDITELPNGNLLVTTSDPTLQTIEDVVLEIDRGNGHILRKMEYSNYLDVNRPREIPSRGPNDWLHMNSIVYDQTDRSIIISSRGQSAIVKQSYPDMKLQWILGSHENWSEKYQPYLLTPIGENLVWPWSQHHATILIPRNPDENILDILLFDNGQYRSFDMATAFSPLKSYTRVVHYRIDEDAMTVEQVWEYGKERGSEIFSAIGGSAYQQINGDILGTWGSIARDRENNPILKPIAGGTVHTKIIEVDPKDSQVIFECTVDSPIYRAFRSFFYTGYSEKNAYLSTDIQDKSGNDLYDRGQLAWADIKAWTNKIPVLLAIKRLVRKILAFAI